MKNSAWDAKWQTILAELKENFAPGGNRTPYASIFSAALYQ